MSTTNNYKRLLMPNLLFLINIFYYATSARPESSEIYPYSMVLQDNDPPNEVILYWKHTNETISFELHVRNSQWIAFGVKNENISDLIVTWLNIDKTGHFSDRTLTSRDEFFVDKKQDWRPLDVFKIKDYTIFKFSRSIKIECENHTEDLDLINGVNKVVFAYGNLIDYENETIKVPLLFVKFVTLLNSSLGPFNCVKTVEKSKFSSNPLGIYTNYADLVENGIYRLYWNYSITDFIGEIHVKTIGWVSFGFSPNGKMNQSDIVVGWITENGRVNFTDRFILGNRPIIDKNQDWKLLNWSERDGYTIFKFQRLIKLCDPNDRVIEVHYRLFDLAMSKSDDDFIYI